MYKQSNSGSGNNKEPPTYKSVVKKAIKDSLSKNPKLERFLEDNHAKGRFIRACTKNANGINHEYNSRSVSYMCKAIETGTSPIMNCFTWSTTTECWAFWKKLESKFQDREK